MVNKKVQHDLPQIPYLYVHYDDPFTRNYMKSCKLPKSKLIGSFHKLLNVGKSIENDIF